MLMLVVARMLILVVALMLVFVVALCYDRPRLSFWGKLFAHPNVDFNNTTLLKRTVASWTILLMITTLSRKWLIKPINTLV